MQEILLSEFFDDHFARQSNLPIDEAGEITPSYSLTGEPLTFGRIPFSGNVGFINTIFNRHTVVSHSANLSDFSLTIFLPLYIVLSVVCLSDNYSRSNTKPSNIIYLNKYRLAPILSASPASRLTILILFILLGSNQQTAQDGRIISISHIILIKHLPNNCNYAQK